MQQFPVKGKVYIYIRIQGVYTGQQGPSDGPFVGVILVNIKSNSWVIGLSFVKPCWGGNDKNDQLFFKYLTHPGLNLKLYAEGMKKSDKLFRHPVHI